MCDKSFSLKDSYTKHIFVCHKHPGIIKLKKRIEDKFDKIKILESENKMLLNQVEEHKRTIQELQDKLENIAIKAVQRPTTTNKTQINNYIHNMQPVTTEYLLESAPKLTLEHIQKGASGYAEYALEHPLKDRVVCVDYSRRKLKFKDKEGNVVTDPEMAKLAPMFFNSIRDKSGDIIFSQNTPDMSSVMFEEVAKLFNINCDVRNAARGVKTEFYYDFIKHICSGSVVE